MDKWCLPLLLVFFVVAACGQGTHEDFISIDCGNTKNYTDDITKLAYTSDDQYIETGVNANIARNYMSHILYTTDLNLRSFPSGDRNCYTLKPVVPNSTYLIRAAFFHGDYDSHFSAEPKKPILFDLYIGVSKWRTVNVTDPGFPFWHEAITVSLFDSMYICLVNTGQGTPFINSLEMRLLKSAMYPYVDKTRFVDLYKRVDTGGSKFTRYPDDKYDRIWIPYMMNDCANISTTLRVNSNFTTSFTKLPSAVLQTAVIPSKSAPNTSNLEFNWIRDEGVDAPFFINLYFAEIQQLPAGIRREFDIYYNGIVFYDHINPMYLRDFTVLSTTEPPPSMRTSSNEYSFTINATSNSTVPALLNAFEIFSLLSVETKMTSRSDTDAILAIKREYKINKGWTGDPCAPVNYTWVGVGCEYTGNSSKIISLNLSNSGLTGSISSSFSKLQNIKILDLSDNSLNGTIPDFLAAMTSLKVLDLSGNSFNCTIPDILQKKSISGMFMLVNGNECAENTSKNPTFLIIGFVVADVVVLIQFVLLFIVLRRRRNASKVEVQEQKLEVGICEVQLKIQKFTKSEVENVTDNFTNQIGGGRFGGVFAGTLKDGARVAVKRISKLSKQAQKEFLTEAENLAMLHHKNLLSMVGYCEDRSCLALVYEYMPQGTLKDHIRGNRGTLGWKERLRIALEAAQGLEYMHKGCGMPIVHRDVKSTNILLGDNLEAKVADLGLARAFHSNDQGTLTTVCGTPGYIDPEFFYLSMLTEKSDVYSFGVVLLEIITGQPPVIRGSCHILHHVSQRLRREDITSVIDRRFEGDFDVNSVWKVLELAMSCTKKKSVRRPTMSDVVVELKESLDLEANRVRSRSKHEQNIGMSSSVHNDVISIRCSSCTDVDSAGDSIRSESLGVVCRSNFENDFTGIIGPSLR